MVEHAHAYLRYQQARWMRADAARWVRPDAAKFLKRGTRLEDVYPALATKYNDGQPRVAAGNSDGGQWTSGSGGSGRPRVHIYRSDPESEEVGDGGSGFLLPSLSFDIGDLLSDIDWSDLFDIKPRKPRSGGVRLAGQPPDPLPAIVVKPNESESPRIGHNGGPPLDPPEIPDLLPDTTEGRMTFVRRAAQWIGRIGRRAPAVDVFLGALEQVETLTRLTDVIKTANDPPETLDVLKDRVSKDSTNGYHDHHIVNQHRDNLTKFGKTRIDSRDNLVRIPVLKHIEISRWYATGNEKYGGRPPREALRLIDWEEQMRIGLEVLRDFQVLKP